MALQSLQLMWDVQTDPRFISCNVKPLVNVLQSKGNYTKDMEMKHIEVRRIAIRVVCRRASELAKFVW